MRRFDDAAAETHAAFVYHHRLARRHRPLCFGEIDRAAELVRRRSSARGWPRYLASYLRMEARLAEQMRDTTRTRAALQHYLALRTRPEAVMSREVDSLRVWLRRLDGN